MASVRKRKGTDKWIITYTDPDTGKRVQGGTFKLKKDADKERLRLETEVEAGSHTAASRSITVKVLAEEFMRSLEARKREERGVGATYVNSVDMSIRKSIVPEIGAVVVADIRFADVEKVSKAMGAAGYAPKMIKMRLNVLNLMLQFAIRRGYTKRNPVPEVNKDRGPTRSKPVRVFSQPEVLRVLEAADQEVYRAKRHATARMRLFVHTAAFCGLRVGEIAALAVADIDFDRSLIQVRASVTRFGEVKGPKTRAGIRDVPMPPHVAGLLRDWIEQHYRVNDDGRLFQDRRKYASGYSQTWNHHNHRAQWIELLDRAGLAEHPEEGWHHFHALRHFAASMMIGKGWPVTDVATILGHSHFDTTLQTYAHALLPQARQVSESCSMATSLLESAPALSKHLAVTHEVASG